MPTATAVITIQVDGREKLGRLAKRLHQEGSGGLRRRINEGLTDNGDKALQAVRKAWLGVDVQSSKGGGVEPDNSTGLRGRIAAATRLHEIRDGLRYQVHANMVDSRYGQTLVYGVDGLKPWAHPVFDDPDIDWEKEVGEEVFYSTLYKFYPVWRQGILNGMEASARFIAGG